MAIIAPAYICKICRKKYILLQSNIPQIFTLYENGLCQNCLKSKAYYNKEDVDKLIEQIKVLNNNFIELNNNYNKQLDKLLEFYINEITLEYCEKINEEIYYKTLTQEVFNLTGYKRLKNKYIRTFLNECKNQIIRDFDNYLHERTGINLIKSKYESKLIEQIVKIEEHPLSNEGFIKSDVVNYNYYFFVQKLNSWISMVLLNFLKSYYYAPINLAYYQNNFSKLEDISSDKILSKFFLKLKEILKNKEKNISE